MMLVIILMPTTRYDQLYLCINGRNQNLLSFKSLYVKEQLNEKAAENCSSCKILTTHVLHVRKTLCSRRSKNAFDLIFSPHNISTSPLSAVFCGRAA